MSHPQLLATRFFAKVNKTPTCWLWTASVKHPDKPYGQFWIPDKMVAAHRVSFFLAHNRWPTQDLMHTCDTPRCVNPDHLLEATPQANNEDKLRKNRHWHTLTEQQVRSIYQQAAEGIPYTEIARGHNTTVAHVCQIATGVTWRHLGLQPIYRTRLYQGQPHAPVPH